MLFGHDEGKNIVQLCNGSDDAVCIEMGGTGAKTAPEAVEKIGIYPVDSIYTTSKNENPASYLGGTWELIDKKFKRATFNSDDVEGLITLGAHMSEASVTFVLNDNEILVGGSFTLADSWSNLDYIVFKTDLAKLGCSRLSIQTYTFATANTAEGIGWGSFAINGDFTAYKMFPDTDGGTMPANRKLVFNTSLPVAPSFMEDAFCDRFFWERTA